MVRCRLLLRLGVVFVLALVPVYLFANPPASGDAAFKNSLALQQAMEAARHHLLQSESRKAVDTLEEQLPRVNGHAPFLRLLREAYRTHIKHLCLANQPELAQRYVERLCILEPTAANDPTLRPPQTEEKKAFVEAPAKAPSKPPDIFPNFAKTHPKTGNRDNVYKPTAVRAKPDEDPFDPAHERKPDFSGEKSRLAEQLVANANEAWARRRFQDAQGYYAQAYQAEPRSIDPCRERWGYCMLNTVVERLNNPSLGGQTLADLQQQVHGALTLAPNLDKTGQWLLREIEQRHKSQTAGAAPARNELIFDVQHHGRNQQGWSVTETKHFRIYHNQARDLVDKTAQTVERTSLAMVKKWLGQETLDWPEKCDVVLYTTSADYSKMTGVPASSPGHAHIESDSSTGRVLSRRLHLRCDNPELLTVTLPHETTHVALSGHFGQHALPRWADEGIASLSEPPEKLEKYRRSLQRLAREGQTLFSLRDLFALQNYPERRRIDAFYAQSVTLVEYLAQLRGPTTLPEFVRDALRHGYDAALQKHYSMDMSELHMRWQQRVLGDGAVAQRE